MPPLPALLIENVLLSPVVHILLCPSDRRTVCALAVLVQKALLDHQLLLTCLANHRRFDIRTVSAHKQASRLHAGGSLEFLLCVFSARTRSSAEHSKLTHPLQQEQTRDSFKVTKLTVSALTLQSLCSVIWWHRAFAHTTAAALDSSLPCSPHRHLVLHPAHRRGSMKTPYSDSPLYQVEPLTVGSAGARHLCPLDEPSAWLKSAILLCSLSDAQLLPPIRPEPQRSDTGPFPLTSDSP